MFIMSQRYKDIAAGALSKAIESRRALPRERSHPQIAILAGPHRIGGLELPDTADGSRDVIAHIAQIDHMEFVLVVLDAHIVVGNETTGTEAMYCALIFGASEQSSVPQIEFRPYHFDEQGACVFDDDVQMHPAATDSIERMMVHMFSKLPQPRAH